MDVGVGSLPPQLQARASPLPVALCVSLFGLSSQATSLRDVAKQIPNYGGCAVLLDRRRASGSLAVAAPHLTPGGGGRVALAFLKNKSLFLVVVAEASQQVAEPRVRSGSTRASLAETRSESVQSSRK